ncbi:unnamed protein product [Cochlearia groenlandica]
MLGGLHTILTFSDSVHSIPVNLETRQRIAFFIWDCLDEIYIRCGVPDIWVSKSKEGADEIMYLMKQHEALRIAYILGVREHIFTGSVSSLAWFMSAHETSFVTLGQRVLANPLKFKMHYGYPDGFDWFLFLTRGGISKASRVINISEDIFPGFNCTLQGRNVTHHEFIQVASGSREQVLSRDVLWLGLNLDFFMMLSFYYTTVGFYLYTMMVVLTIYAFLWGWVYLALGCVEKSALLADTDSADNNSALA